MGDRTVTTQNLEIVAVDEELGLLLVKGAVPGSKNSYVLVKDAVKKALPKDAPKPAGLKSSSAPAPAAAKEEAPAQEEQQAAEAPAAEAAAPAEGEQQ